MLLSDTYVERGHLDFYDADLDRSGGDSIATEEMERKEPEEAAMDAKKDFFTTKQLLCEEKRLKTLTKAPQYNDGGGRVQNGRQHSECKG